MGLYSHNQPNIWVSYSQPNQSAQGRHLPLGYLHQEER